MPLEYVVAREGETLGPYTEQELRRQLKTGALALNDLAATTGSGEWKSLQSIFEDDLETVKYVSPEEVSDDDDAAESDALIARAVQTWRVPEHVGDRIGPYELVEEIGHGGFGLVFRAVQEEPIRRTLALKIIKPGMDTREVIARFEAERQALALMDHPNIARVFDAGATQTGLPFFVMELVEGEPFNRYCDGHRLGLKQRLGLFLDVCSAVQHAHQKGIVHRDLKPTNLLVTEQDGAPFVKVIDFGIAKAIDQELTGNTFHTTRGSFIGTPQYMSPEQAASTGVDVDTRSDVYSLGVVLYELLTGQTPISKDRIRKANPDEIYRLIAEEDPEKPSARLQSLEGESRIETARARGEAPGQLGKTIRGDLEWVVMKALEKERDRRYDTVSAFSTDLRRYLENEPVLASPPSVSYRVGKFIRRNRLMVMAAALVAAALVAGTIVSTWQASVARDRAAEAGAVLDFLETKVIAAARPKGLDGGLGIDATIRQAVDAAEAEVETNFSDWPEVEASLRETLGTGYRHLGEYKKAIAQCEEGLRLRRETLGAEDPQTLAAMENLALAYAADRRDEEALALREPVYEQCRKQLGERHPDTLVAANALANSLAALGRREEALGMRRRTLEIRQELLGAMHPDTLDSMNNLILSLLETGDVDEAVDLGEKTLELVKEVRGPEHPSTLATMNNLAVAYRKAGRDAEAGGLEEQALTLRKMILGETHPDTLVAGQEQSRPKREKRGATFFLPRSDGEQDLRKKQKGMQSPTDAISSVASDMPELSEFVLLLKKTGQLERLSEKGPFTLLAPVNEAFAKLPEGTMDQWFEPSGEGELEGIFHRHIIPDRIPGAVVDIDSRIDLTGVRLLRKDIPCSNGVIHVIDTFLRTKTQ